MKELRVVLSSSAVDKHGDVMSIGALHSLAEHINSGWIPAGVEHDPRIPPWGRVASAAVKKREDGIYIVEGVIEAFEAGDSIPPPDNEREMSIHRLAPGEFEVAYDRSFEMSNQLEHVESLAKLFNAQPKMELKKAVDPISVLTIVAGVTLGAFCKSFFGKIGEKLGGQVAERLKALFNADAKRDANDNLLVFTFCCEIEGGSIEYQVILSNPSDETIDAFLTKGIFELDAVAQQHFEAGRELRRIVYEYDGTALTVRFAVRRDAISLFPGFEPEEPDGDR